MIKGEVLPTPQEFDAEPPAYLNGLTETLGELRRRCLDCFVRVTVLRLNGFWH
jgi:predicted translin family RNA/ssDNA-binding protein